MVCVVWSAQRFPAISTTRDEYFESGESQNTTHSCNDGGTHKWYPLLDTQGVINDESLNSYRRISFGSLFPAVSKIRGTIGAGGTVSLGN